MVLFSVYVICIQHITYTVCDLYIGITYTVYGMHIGITYTVYDIHIGITYTVYDMHIGITYTVYQSVLLPIPFLWILNVFWLT